MSILLGPYDKPEEHSDSSTNDKEFLVFGYQCRLYRNDEKASMENEGALLIPWMGDNALMVDRYDVRNRFDDKSQFGLKSSLPHRLTEAEEELEKQLDQERYMAMGTDITEEEIQREEERKRMYELVAEQGTYNAVNFSYGATPSDEKGEGLVMDQPAAPEHLSTSYADNPEDGGEYERPFRLSLLPNIETPLSQKLHAVIERTAIFVSKQGQQMEIIIKTKQRFNPSFSFLNHEDRLFPYYKHVLRCIIDGSYEPLVAPVTDNTVVTTATEKNAAMATSSEIEDSNNSEQLKSNNNKGDGKNILVGLDYDSDSESEDEFELHPILRATLTAPDKPQPHSVPNTDSHPNTDPSKFKSRTFKSIAYTINSAPSVTQQQEEPAKTTGNSLSTATTDTESVDLSSTNSVSAPGYTITGNGYDPMRAYYEASQVYHTGALPPPPDLQPVVDKTAEYVAKNGDKFEATVILKHLDDSRFGFLHPWNQYNHYYKTKVSDCREAFKLSQDELPDSMQKLSNTGAVSFKVTGKTSTPSFLGRSVVDNEEGNEENGLGEPPGKRVKVTLEDDVPMDNTIKQFLLTVRNSFD